MAQQPLRVALIKMSSMGDVIHAMPVVTDLLAARPGTTIDWIVEEGFADLPRLHPGVHEVLPVALRRWRKQWRSRTAWQELRHTRALFGRRRYDAVLDLQGLLKSVWVAGWLHGEKLGYARSCVREPLASFSYARSYVVNMHTHAISKMRSLAAQAFDYQPAADIVFGLTPPPLPDAFVPAADSAGPYRVFLHATSRAEKLWPAREWVALLRESARQERVVYLPWGSPAEQAAAHALVAQAGHGIVLPSLSLAGCAGLLGAAEAVVGVDTGLTHLAAALDRPTIALFAATESWRYGPTWSKRAASLGADGNWPTADEVSERLVGVLGASM